MNTIPEIREAGDLMRRWAGTHGLIFVTGPNFSGTSLVAKVLSSETGRSVVTEDAWDTHDREKFIGVVRDLKEVLRVVVHCPGMMRWLHEIGPAHSGADKPNLVVIVQRNLLDIYRAEERHKWQFEQHEMAKYVSGRPALVRGAARPHSPPELVIPTLLEHQKDVKDDHPQAAERNTPRSAEVKYHFWRNVQVPLLNKKTLAQTVFSYESLESHAQWRKLPERDGPCAL